ncbi:rod shape-determining protein MreC [Flavobacterium rhizosphaerae]|uniref:Cell shape-determining protein MreC n=1 Tax=Flavobacterium rhizosphaerae TaxID=3163298 RepID=A0ABW8YSE8_9FLAO
MQQIFSFIYKNSIFLLFLLLLGISLTFTIQSHSYHRSRTISSANAVSGFVYQQIDNVETYLSLKEENQKLADENTQLKKLLFNTTDSVKVTQLPLASGTFNVIPAKAINNSYSLKENYFTINKGRNDGVNRDMGVVSSLGVVGIVEQTSKNYATVISVLNTNFRLDAKMKKNNHFGTLIWNGKSTGFAQLIDVPRLASVHKGDTIVTGAESRIFPENIPIGTIETIYTDQTNNYFTIDVRLFNDMTSLGHVYIIENKDQEEIIQLEQQTVNE